MAAKGAERDQVVYESADLLYHLAVLWRASGVTPRRGGARARVAAPDDPPAPGGPRAARLAARRDSPGVDARAGHGRPPRPGAAGPHLHRRLRDAGERLPQAARRRPGVPAGVGRARAPGALLDDRRAAAGGDPRRRRGAGRDRRRRRDPAAGRLGPVRRRRGRGRPGRHGAAARAARLLGRRRGVLRLRPGAHRRAPAGPAARRPRHPRPDRPHHRPGGGLRPHAPLADHRGALPGGATTTPRRPTGARSRPSRSCKRPPVGPGPAPARARGGADARPGHQQPHPRGLRGRGGAGARVHLRRRRLPGRALAALLGADGRSTPSPSTAACARSTPRRTCSSSRPAR